MKIGPLSKAVMFSKQTIYIIPVCVCVCVYTDIIQDNLWVLGERDLVFKKGFKIIIDKW